MEMQKLYLLVPLAPLIGAMIAGLFLKEFVGETPWAHVDMAGPVSASKEWGHISKGPTGFGVATLVEYLVPAANAAASA